MSSIDAQIAFIVASSNKGHRSEVYSIAKQLCEQHPDNPDVWWAAAQVFSEPERQKRALMRALSLDPDHQRAQNQMQRLQQTQPAPRSPQGQQSPQAQPLLTADGELALPVHVDRPLHTRHRLITGLTVAALLIMSAVLIVTMTVIQHQAGRSDTATEVPSLVTIPRQFAEHSPFDYELDWSQSIAADSSCDNRRFVLNIGGGHPLKIHLTSPDGRTDRRFDFGADQRQMVIDVNEESDTRFHLWFYNQRDVAVLGFNNIRLGDSLMRSCTVTANLTPNGAPVE